MTGAMICVAGLLFGVDVGWQPLPGGGMEYIIQLDPDTRQSLRPNEPVESYFPADVRDVRKCRVVFGKEKLPQQLAPAKPAAAPAGPAIGPTEKTPETGPREVERPSRGKLWGANLPGPMAFAPTDTTATRQTGSVVPATLPETADSKPIVKPAGHVEGAADPAKSAASPQSADSPSSSQPAKPWSLLWATVLALGASLTGNAYLGWIYVEARRRCRALLAGTSEAGT